MEEKDYFEYTELVTVFTTGDMGLMAIAKSILDSEGIKYSIVGDNFQNILGVGIQAGIFSNSGTAAQIQVMPKDSKEAIEILAELSKS